ncbi:MAG: HD domain-containing protein [Chloroflexi bacterium]|nr:HD domain-containing protein [Chloroflexota bacterium]
MITKALLLRLFDAAYMQRWNDKLRPVELYELDKQAHKMVIAYFLGKFEEDKAGFDWLEIIEGGLFEYLQRVVLTDIKPPVYYRIKADQQKYRELNEYVFAALLPLLGPLGPEFCTRFRAYFLDSTDGNINRRILSAAHFCASDWEFRILERTNPDGSEMGLIRQNLDEQQNAYADLQGMMQLKMQDKCRHFINLCGELRFQVRWSNIHRVPMTSVLGHMLFVAMLSYLFSLEVKAAKSRCVNNYFTGLFHDLPEVLTRDIILPVKRAVSGLHGLIKDIEKEYMNRSVYGLIPYRWRHEMRLFAEDEFSDSIVVNGKRHKVTAAEIMDLYNDDRHSARDGTLVKAADRLAAFIEADQAIQNGSRRHELFEARAEIGRDFQRVKMGGLDLARIYSDFA